MTWSRMPVCARPVRTLARSPLNAWTLLSIFWSVVFFRSAMTMVTSSYVNEGALIFAQNYAPQGVLLEDVEDVDRQLLVAAQRERGGIHHLEVLVDRLVEADLGVALRVRVALGVVGVHPVHLGALQHDLGAHLAGAQRRWGVRGEERVAGAGGEDPHLAPPQIADRLATDIGLAPLLDVERRLDPAGDPRLAHGIGERQGVHDRGEHAHVVGGGPVHPLGTGREAAEDVAAADHHAHLDPKARDLRYLRDDVQDRLPVDAVRILSHQGLARELEENSFVFRSHDRESLCGISALVNGPSRPGP